MKHLKSAIIATRGTDKLVVNVLPSGATEVSILRHQPPTYDGARHRPGGDLQIASFVLTAGEREKFELSL
jgi:hypothetical protein